MRKASPRYITSHSHVKVNWVNWVDVVARVLHEHSGAFPPTK